MRTRIVLLVIAFLYLVTIANAQQTADRAAGIRGSLRPIAKAVTPALSLNKRHEPNTAITTWQVGLPIEYVVSVHNGGAPTTHATITDTLPAGFVVSNISAIYAFGASGPNTLVPPAFGDFTMPTGGDVELHIKGYFTTAGLKVNTAEATAKENGVPVDVGTANKDDDPVNIPDTKLPVDLSAEKSVTAISTTFPAKVHYVLTIKNNSATAVNLGGVMSVRDNLRNDSSATVGWTASNFTCTASAGADCPDLPATLTGTLSGYQTVALRFKYDTTAGANDFGFMPGNGHYAIAFDVDFTTASTCSKGIVVERNSDFLDTANGMTIINDQSAGNNSSAEVSTTITGLPTTCPPDPPPLITSVAKSQLTASLWGLPGVKYSVKVTNPNTVTLTNVSLSDVIYKGTGTPPFTAVVTAGPACNPACATALTNVVVTTQTITSDYTPATIWSAMLPSLAPSRSETIEYTVVYTPVCETDPRQDVIYNQFTATNSGVTSPPATITTQPGEAGKCDLALNKTAKTPGPILFEQPYDYLVVFQNLSPNATRVVGTVRDVIMIDSNRYGDIPFDYSVSCTATGSVTTVPAPYTVTNGTIKYQQFPWLGVKVIDQHLTFGPSSTLTCQVKVTLHRPKDDNPFCQGAGSPKLVNSILMDLSPNYNPNDSHQPGFFSSVATALPLCRKVVITKTPNTPNVGPGAPITYTITAVNLGDDPVSGLTLADAVPPPLVATSVSPQCNPSAGCLTPTPVLTGNTATVNYGALTPNSPVSFTLNVTAPQAGGSYTNVAVGSFPPFGNYYFQGNPALLQQAANITVLTPVLTKAFNPTKITGTGTSTLTFMITNTNSDPKQTGMSFSDTLPPALQASGLTSDCGGTASVSTDGHTISLTGGQLVGSGSNGSGKHVCTITAKISALGVCGIFTNNKTNFTNVSNIDVSGVDEKLEVADCPPGLLISKIVKGAPAGFTGQFTFNVHCTASGKPDYNKTVTVSWPTPGFTSLSDIQTGYQCSVTEGPLPATLPHELAWTGTTYSPEGKVTITDKGGKVDVTNTIGEHTGCLRIVESNVSCELDKSGRPTGRHIWTFRFQNLSGRPIYHAFIAGLPAPVTVVNDHLVFTTPVTGVSPLNTVIFENAQPGPLTFLISLHDQSLECCSMHVTIDLPQCDCAQIVNEVKPSCFSSNGVPPPYIYSFSLQNLSPLVVENVLIAPVSPLDHLTPIATSALTVGKAVHPVAPVPPGGTIGPIKVVLGGADAVGGREVCLNLSIHTKDIDNCCSIVRCFTLPKCDIPTGLVTGVGSAEVTPNAEGFTISHIGSTGNDGVSLKVPDARRAGLAWLPLDGGGALPDGAFIELRAAGNPGQATGRLRVTKQDGEYQITTAIDDARTYQVEVFDGDQLVGSAGNQPGVNVIVIWPRAASVEILRRDAELPDETLAFTLDTETSTAWRLSDGSTLTGDRFRISPEQPVGPVSLQTVELRAANIPSIEITGTAIFRDCNGNGNADAEDIADGTSADANGNGIPDECEIGQDLALVLNTGFDDASGTLLPLGTLSSPTSDDDWRIIAPGLDRFANVVVQPNPAWPEAFPGSRWISVNPDGNSPAGVSQVRFQRCFCLASSTREVTLNMEIRADDAATLSLNGQKLAGPGGMFSDRSPLSFALTGRAGDGLFVAGENCIQIDVSDRGVAEGLAVAGTVTAAAGSCPP
jgi:uncharacterized repeat protein (TIGR01451 family)